MMAPAGEKRLLKRLRRGRCELIFDEPHPNLSELQTKLPAVFARPPDKISGAVMDVPGQMS